MFQAIPDDLIDPDLELAVYAHLHTHEPMPPALIDTLLMRTFGWTPQQLSTVSKPERRSLLTCLRAYGRYEARRAHIRPSKKVIFESTADPRATAAAIAKELERRIGFSGA